MDQIEQIENEEAQIIALGEIAAAEGRIAEADGAYWFEADGSVYCAPINADGSMAADEFCIPEKKRSLSWLRSIIGPITNPEKARRAMRRLRLEAAEIGALAEAIEEQSDLCGYDASEATDADLAALQVAQDAIDEAGRLLLIALEKIGGEA